MGMVMEQYSVCLVNLDPAVGHEIKKTRPCVIISPDEMNQHMVPILVPVTQKMQSKCKFAP